MTKVLILAGGEGTRLRPLTKSRPKPDVYLGGSKRIVEYVLDAVVKAGYFDVTMALEYMPDNIKNYFGNGSSFIYGNGDGKTPLSISYSQAAPGDSFVGTADALRKSRVHIADKLKVRNRHTQEESEITPNEYLADLKEKANYTLLSHVENFGDILVCSGDTLTNFDLSPLIDFHKSQGAIATIASYRMPKDKIAGKLGILTQDEDGRILKFTEKPALADIDSDLTNAGIYVFDKSVFSILKQQTDINDFGNHLFPELLRTHPKDLFGFEMKGYWNDIGTIENYRETNLHLIDGIEGISILSQKQREQENNRIRGMVKHSLIGQGCEIDEGAVVEDSVIGNDVYVGKNTHLKRCIVFPNTSVHEDVNGNGWILDRNVHMYKGAEAQEGVVIGRGTTVKPGARISAGVKIGRGQTIAGEVKEDLFLDH